MNTLLVTYTLTNLATSQSLVCEFITPKPVTELLNLMERLCKRTDKTTFDEQVTTHCYQVHAMMEHLTIPEFKLLAAITNVTHRWIELHDIGLKVTAIVVNNEYPDIQQKATLTVVDKNAILESKHNIVRLLQDYMYESLGLALGVKEPLMTSHPLFRSIFVLYDLTWEVIPVPEQSKFQLSKI